MEPQQGVHFSIMLKMIRAWRKKRKAQKLLAHLTADSNPKEQSDAYALLVMSMAHRFPNEDAKWAVEHCESNGLDCTGAD